MSAKLNARFEVGRVDIVFFNRVLLKDIYIEDQQGDTLLKADRLTATIQSFSRKERNIFFNQIILQNARINFRKDPDSLLNLRFIADALASEDTTRVRWDYAINGIHLKDSRFTYTNHSNSRQREGGVNFHEIDINNLNLLVNKIHTTTDSIHFNIKYLNFNEKSGFSLNHLASENSISYTGINLENLRIVTPHTILDLEHFDMLYREFGDFNDFVNLVNIRSSFNSSVVNMRDIAYFAPVLDDYDMEVTMSGSVSGRINNLKGDNINLKSVKETSLLANFSMLGLPDFNETFMFLDLKHFHSTVKEILEFTEPGFKNNGRELPLNLSNLEEISYRGKFTGFINDFVAYGELTSNLGTLTTDLSLQPDSDNLLNFNGRLRAVHFDAGSLIGTDKVGKISFNAGLNGLISPNKGVHADLDGIIDSVQILDYNYQQIGVAGKLAERRFEGYAKIDDPNISLDFLGIIDLSKEIPEFDFAAEVDRARLFDLNLEDKIHDLQLSFTSTANFTGDNLDNLNGQIKLVDAVLEKADHIFRIDNASLEAAGKGDQRYLTFNSELADARIEGNYEFATIAGSFNQLISFYIPSFIQDQTNLSETKGNNFSFNIDLKEVSTFTRFFFPQIYISSGTNIKGIFNPSGINSKVTGFCEELRISNQIFKNLSINTQSADSVFKINSNIGYFLAGNLFRLENININTDISNDSLSFHTEWNNRDEQKYLGQLIAVAGFEKKPGGKTPAVDINILPSNILIADSLWHISESRIRIDSTSCHIDNFIFGQTDRHLMIDGKLTEHPHDSVHFNFHNMTLDHIELLTTLTNFQLTGILDGNISISDIHNNPSFETGLKVKDLALNKQDFGNMSILSRWNSDTKSIDIHTFSDRGPDRIINIEGSYIPEGGILDFDIDLDKINLHTFDGYLEQVFGNLRGVASAGLTLEGDISRPQFNGEVLLKETFFHIDYLKTQYNFTHEVLIKNNNIIFNDLLVYDVNHNTCRANGIITNNNFRDFSLNIYLYPDRFMSLNTLERDNELFYGRVIASGLVHITGPTDNISMDISARTNRNTRFFIPLTKSSELEDFHFINFTKNNEFIPDANKDENDAQKDESEQEERRYEVDLSGIQLNFDLNITPEAEVQIIFDSKIGDIIRGNGSGSLKMVINTLGQFNIFGEYTIDKGDYLFTLQNVINKRFAIERGSRISWNGDPLDANIDLKASYRVRASLNAIMAPFNNTGMNDVYTRRIPVDCQIMMKHKLMNPDISFAIELPTADPDTRRNMQGLLNTEEKRNRQFLSLLVINNFMPEHDIAGQGRASSLGMSATEASMTTVSEFFSNQLSNWLSQLSRDVDFGVNWRPGDEITPDEVELALSTQLLNDRIRINGHVDVGGRQTSTSNIVGDMDVEFKLSQSGKLRLKAYTRANDNLIRPYLSPYTQGISLFYREDFNTFNELMERYWNKVFSGNREMNE